MVGTCSVGQHLSRSAQSRSIRVAAAGDQERKTRTVITHPCHNVTDDHSTPIKFEEPDAEG
ncbi:hypothetical protein [Saccharopolyspora sp. ASAGF58]|uniref:hypothetical protein n=1 Tax=Saccharopolyspora sp. ASAGF58 TaxID=2719023 RepID=UPI00143FF093|nr:hypothetical protein [Saccharopolyspora sp. ASAGF58]QIZ34099.1 hypothetical protein FDZ84_04305 [Saccharopolyspora sp. ASAGF58]